MFTPSHVLCRPVLLVSVSSTFQTAPSMKAWTQVGTVQYLILVISFLMIPHLKWMPPSMKMSRLRNQWSPSTICSKRWRLTINMSTFWWMLGCLGSWHMCHVKKRWFLPADSFVNMENCFKQQLTSGKCTASEFPSLRTWLVQCSVCVCVCVCYQPGGQCHQPCDQQARHPWLIPCLCGLFLC